MSTEDKAQLLPKLRFPEFRGTEGWTHGQLESALLSISNGIALEQSSEATGYKVTRIETISAGTIDLEKIGLVKTAQDISAYKLQVGDILLSNINSVAHIGKSVFIDRDYDLYHGMNLLRLLVNRTKNEPKFIFYVINTNGIRASLRERANKAVNQASINQTELGKTKVALPAITEQKKIANCLSSLDKLIAAQARKVEALKTHKKGLMQQLFPCEGETQPRLRFPAFQNAEDWEMKSLGSFSKVGDIDHKMPSSTAHGIPYIMTGDFFGMNDIDYENAKKISIEDYEQLSKKIKPELGDIIIARYASVGAVRYIQTTLKFLASYSCAVIKCNKLEDSRYIYYALQSDVIQSQIRLEINTSSQKNIGIDSIKKLNAFLPTLSEQLKISACLAGLDTQITAATQELDTLKTHKKGLMQQLFPSAEAVEA